MSVVVANRLIFIWLFYFAILLFGTTSVLRGQDVVWTDEVSINQDASFENVIVEGGMVDLHASTLTVAQTVNLSDDPPAIMRLHENATVTANRLEVDGPSIRPNDGLPRGQLELVGNNASLNTETLVINGHSTVFPGSEVNTNQLFVSRSGTNG